MQVAGKRCSTICGTPVQAISKHESWTGLNNDWFISFTWFLWFHCFFFGFFGFFSKVWEGFTKKGLQDCRILQFVEPNTNSTEQKHTVFSSDTVLVVMLQNKTVLREGSGFQIRWTFGKIPNGLQTPPPSYSEDYIAIFYDRHGCIYARMYDGQIVWNACTWFPEIGTILRVGGGSQLPFGTFPKFIRFGSVTRSLDCYDY